VPCSCIRPTYSRYLLVDTGVYLGGLLMIENFKGLTIFRLIRICPVLTYFIPTTHLFLVICLKMADRNILTCYFEQLNFVLIECRLQKR